MLLFISVNAPCLPRVVVALVAAVTLILNPHFIFAGDDEYHPGTLTQTELNELVDYMMGHILSQSSTKPQKLTEDLYKVKIGRVCYLLHPRKGHQSGFIAIHWVHKGEQEETATWRITVNLDGSILNARAPGNKYPKITENSTDEERSHPQWTYLRDLYLTTALGNFKGGE